MFHEMRRKKQALSFAKCEEILRRATFGVLALSEADAYPYAVPLSYVYADSKIYFHSALEGHKIDAVPKCGRASFCVIDQDDIKPEEYTTYFRSMIAFGTIRIMEEEDAVRAAIEKLAVKYYPQDQAENRSRTIDNAWHKFYMLELSIEHMTGKEALELVKAP